MTAGGLWKSDPELCPKLLLWLQPERLELLAPLCGSITKSFDADAAGQSTFDGCPDQIRCQERQRDGHVDLTRATFLTRRDLLNVRDRARHNLVKPVPTPGDGAYKTCATLDPRRANFISRYAVRNQDLPGFP